MGGCNNARTSGAMERASCNLWRIYVRAIINMEEVIIVFCIIAQKGEFKLVILHTRLECHDHVFIVTVIRTRASSIIEHTMTYFK